MKGRIKTLRSHLDSLLIAKLIDLFAGQKRDQGILFFYRFTLQTLREESYWGLKFAIVSYITAPHNISDFS